jgi:hypothetical protein
MANPHSIGHDMRVWKFILSVLLICSSAVASESRLPFQTVFKGEDQFNRLVAHARSENWSSLPIGERTATVGQSLVGTRYKHFTLEIDNRIEAASVNFTGMDCWTFFEISLGFGTGGKLDAGAIIALCGARSLSRRRMHGRLSFAPPLPGGLAGRQ